MKKKALIAMLLACSFAFGTASMTACNLIGGGDGDGEHQEQGDDTTVAVTGVSLNKDVLNLQVGGSETLTATVAPGNATTKTVTWKSDNTDVAEVDSNGKVTAKAKGQATITVTTTSGGKTDTCVVNVTETTPAPVKVNSVSLSPTSKTLKVGEEVTLTISFNPSNPDNKKVEWSSSDPTVASVVGGVVSANKAGTATITVTTEDGGKTAHCAVTVEQTITTTAVTGVAVNPTAATLKVGATKQLTKTITPANASNQNVTWTSGNTQVATVDNNGLVTAVSAGSATITVRTADGNFTATCAVTVEQKASDPVVDAKISYSYAGNECAAFEWGDSNAAGATVEYKLSTANSYTALSGNDKEFLVRQISLTTARVDFVGLKGGAVYDFKITPSSGTAMTVTNMTINSYDRSGYAHFKATAGVGAYKDDGTPKDNASIVYVNEANKNNVDGKNTSIVELLQNQKGKAPLIVRIVGTVGSATWKEGNVTYTKTDKNVDSSGNLLPSAIVDQHGNALEKRNYTQDELETGDYNDLDTSKYSVIDGLSSTIKWDSSKQEFDSCWNDASISGANNVTIEGIGEDARIFQWGMTFKSSKSIEVRNITFEDYTEDACSFEGSTSGSETSASDFQYGRYWVHHNTFEEGVNYWDVCKEQDKHDGDGSTDIKKVSYVTFAYNIYHNTHKTGLVGADNSMLTAAVTFHHNLYDGCKARLPLARQANMHMYNNYYKGTTGTDISVRGKAYAFVENCFFEGGKDEKTGKAIQSVNFDFPYDAKNGQGWAKVVGCKFTDYSGKEIAANTSFGKSGDNSVSTSNLKLNAGRTDKMNTDNKFGSNFDMDSSVFYYEGGQSKVSVMFTAEETKSYVPQLAGVQKNGVDVTLGGAGGGTGTGTENPNPNPNPGDQTGGTTIVLTYSDFSGGASVTKDGITFTITSDVTTDTNNKSTAVEYNGKNYGSVGNLYLSGGAKLTTDNPSKYLEFTTSKAFKITVVAKGGSGRTLQLVKDKTEVANFGAGATQELTTQTVNEGGTYRLGSTGSGVRIFYVIIEYVD